MNSEERRSRHLLLIQRIGKIALPITKSYLDGVMKLQQVQNQSILFQKMLTNILIDYLNSVKHL